MDGSSRGNLEPAGIGEVGRDSLGIVQFMFFVYKGNHTNNLVEAISILYVVESVRALGWSRLICESDSQVVVHLLSRQHSEEVSWKLALVVNQILNLCASLNSVTFTQIPREWNGVADSLAKWASDHMQNWNIVEKGQLPLGLSQQFDYLVDLDRVV
ncbi:uncharacterized protein LOC131866290 [Cryptomeria japonica]|uniref:uncharacterized protein LOC131866290 n=1 Tax=Cryptomeria japonica TaxID=3369 RepID=UPI0027DA728E|nr:uncharacterized protein LOC131866290 [Cryptomeria japonica]